MSLFGNFGGFDDDDDDFFGPSSRGNMLGLMDRNSNSNQLAQQNRSGRRSSNDPFSMMDRMMSGMGSMSSLGGLGGSSMQMTSFSSSSGPGGPVHQSSSSMVVSSSMGADGQMHTERYQSSAVNDGKTGAFERQQAYSNSRTGQDKMALERQVGRAGRKMVKEYDQ